VSGILHIQITESRCQPPTRLNFDDCRSIGRELDDLLHRNFPNELLAIRALDSRDSRHGNMGRKQLINIIRNSGSDRHDDHQTAQGTAILERQNLTADMYCYLFDLKSVSEYMVQPIWDLYSASAMGERLGSEIYVDVITIYDPKQLEPIPYILEFGGAGTDAFNFQSESRTKAIKGIIEIVDR
jgi:hypothetical protein